MLSLGPVTGAAPVACLKPYALLFLFYLAVWEALSGEAAFQGMHYGQIFEAVALSGQRPPMLPEFPPGAADLIARCWHADVAQRPSMSEVKQAVEELVQRVSEAEHAATMGAGMGDINVAAPVAANATGSLAATLGGSWAVTVAAVPGGGVSGRGQEQRQGADVSGPVHGLWTEAGSSVSDVEREEQQQRPGALQSRHVMDLF